jgi:WD40 repeat protein
MSLVWAADGSKVFWTYGTHSFSGGVGWTAIAGQRKVLSGAKEPAGLCLSRDGRTLYAATRDAIRRWDLAGEVELPSWSAVSPGSLAVSPDGQVLASTHPRSVFERRETFHVALWDIASAELQRRLDCQEYFAGLAFSPDGTRLAALGNQSLWLWELPSGNVVAQHRSKKFYTDLAYSPDGRLLITSGNDATVRIWDGRSGAPLEVLTWGIGKVLCVAFAPDGMRAAAGGFFGDVIVWDVD